MKALILSTLNHNPGDDFIRLGLLHILKSLNKGIEVRTVNKHDPRTLFDGFQQKEHPPHRLIGPLLYQIYKATKGRNRVNYLDDSDIVILAGTPFIWRQNTSFLPSTSANTEWHKAIWHPLFTTHKHIPVLNIAAGTSVESGDHIKNILDDANVTEFLLKAFNRCALTTARDTYTANIAEKLDLPVKLLPCTSLWASKGASIPPGAPEYVTVNAMPSAVHSQRGQHTAHSHWHSTLKKVVGNLKQRHDILFVSHSQDEDDFVAELFPHDQRVFSKDARTLLSAYSKSKFGICNRVHGAAGVATFHKPSLVIGGDTRTDLIKQFGLPTLDHRTATADQILEIADDLEENHEKYEKHLSETSNAYKSIYSDLLSRTLSDVMP